MKPWACTLTDEDREGLRAMVLAMPPLTDDQQDALGDLLADIRLKRAGNKQ